MALAQRRGTQVSNSPRRNATAFWSLSREVRYEGRSIDGDPHSKTILFVDDEPCLLEVWRLVFESLGYRVLTTDSGEDALEIARVNAVDAVILPGMNGDEAARRIRKEHPSVPIILSSGGFSAPDRVLESANAFVSKGAGPEALLEVLEQHLQLVPDGRTRTAQLARLSQSAE